MISADPAHDGTPLTRPGTTMRLEVGPVVVYLIVSLGDHGKPIRFEVRGNTHDVDPGTLAWLSLWAGEASVALERGAGADVFRRALGLRCEPSGPCPAIEGIATSIPDAVSRWTLKRFWS